MPKKEVIKKSAAKKAPIKKNILKLQQENEILTQQQQKVQELQTFITDVKTNLNIID